jgi:hypothetical protein
MTQIMYAHVYKKIIIIFKKEYPKEKKNEIMHFCLAHPSIYTVPGKYFFMDTCVNRIAVSDNMIVTSVKVGKMKSESCYLWLTA